MSIDVSFASITPDEHRAMLRYFDEFERAMKEAVACDEGSVCLEAALRFVGAALSDVPPLGRIAVMAHVFAFADQVATVGATTTPTKQ